MANSEATVPADAPSSEIAAWIGAWRRLPENPILTYLAQAAKRRRLKTPAWQRYLLLILAALAAACLIWLILPEISITSELAIMTILPAAGLVLFVCLVRTEHRSERVLGVRRGLLKIIALLPLAVLLVMVIVSLIIDSSSGAGNTFSRYRLMESAYWILALLACTYLIFALGRIYLTLSDAMRVLAVPQRKSQELVLDDMFAATAIDDRDIVLGMLRALAPRLWIVSLQGAVLAWITASIIMMESRHNLLILILTAPISIGTLAFTGSLAGCNLVLWFICMGRGHSAKVSAPITGVLVCLGHLLHLTAAPGLLAIMIVAVFGGFAGSASLSGDPGFASSSVIITYLGYRIPAAVLFVVAYAAVLNWTVASPQRALASSQFVPFAFPAGLAVIFFATLACWKTSAENMLGPLLAYYQSWGSVIIVNPFAWPSLLLMGCSFDYVSNTSAVLEIGFVILILQQLAILLVSLRMARLAVGHRRCEFT